MTTTPLTQSTTTTRPLFPEPVEPNYPGHKVPGSAYGIHREFCIMHYARERGASVEDHGPICNGPMVGALIPGHRQDGTSDAVWVDLAAPYVHGVYEVEELRAVVRFDEVCACPPTTMSTASPATGSTSQPARPVAWRRRSSVQQTGWSSGL